MPPPGKEKFRFTDIRWRVLASLLDGSDQRLNTAARSAGVKPTTFSSVRNALKDEGILNAEIIPSPLFFRRSILSIAEFYIRPKVKTSELAHILLKAAGEVQGIVTLISSQVKIFIMGLFSSLAESYSARERFVKAFGNDFSAGRNDRHLLLDLTSPYALLIEDYYYTAANLAGHSASSTHQPMSLKFGKSEEGMDERGEFRSLLTTLISDPEISDSSVASRVGFARETVSKYRKQIFASDIAKTVYFMNPETVGAGIISVNNFRLRSRISPSVCPGLMGTGNLHFIASNGDRLLTMGYCRTVGESEQSIASILNYDGVDIDLDSDWSNSLYPFESSPFMMRHVYWRLLEENASHTTA